MNNVFDRRFIYGITFIGLIIGLLVGTVAVYNGALKSTVPVSVESDRAGLTLAHGAPVKLYGVQVGTVKSVEPDGNKVKVDLDINKKQIDQIPANVTAQIVPPTAFGGKYIQLSDNSNDGSSLKTAGALNAGAVIPADRVTTEVDEAFENLTQVLNAAKPNEVNNALTALSTAVDGRGQKIGDLISQVDSYLTSFNPSLQTLSTDLSRSRSVLATYDSALPDLLKFADNTTVTSDTLVDQQASLHAFVVNLNSFSNDTGQFLKSTRTGLKNTLNLLDPVTGVLARYSPELPCLVLGLASANKLAENAVGGTNPGVTTITRIVPGRDPYTYADNLPTVNDTRGPACYGLPYVTPKEAKQPSPRFKTGANPYAGPQPNAAQSDTDTLVGLLLGIRNVG